MSEGHEAAVLLLRQSGLMGEGVSFAVVTEEIASAGLGLLAGDVVVFDARSPGIPTQVALTPHQREARLLDAMVQELERPWWWNNAGAWDVTPHAPPELRQVVVSATVGQPGMPTLPALLGYGQGEDGWWAIHTRPGLAVFDARAVGTLLVLCCRAGHGLGEGAGMGLQWDGATRVHLALCPRPGVLERRLEAFDTGERDQADWYGPAYLSS